MTTNALYVRKLISGYKNLAGNVVILYHANCVDGYLSQLTVRNMLDDFNQSSSWHDECPVDNDFNQVESIADSGNRYIPIQYEYTDVEWLKLIETIKGRHVIVVDFSPTIKILRFLSRQCRSVLVIDHHKTTATKCAEIMAANTLDIIRIRGFNDLSDRDLSLLDEPDEDYIPSSDFENTLVLFEPDMCSAKMCSLLDAIYAIPGMYERKQIEDLVKFILEIPPVYTLTDDYDRYTLLDPRSKSLQAYLHHLMYFGSLSEWYAILDSTGYVSEELLDQCVEKGRLLVQAKEKEITTIIKRNAKPVVIDDVVFIAVNASSSLINEIGERISNETGGPVMIWEERSGYTKVSLRSSANNGNFDVGAFAETKGGGGHRNAANCSMLKDLNLAKRANAEGVIPAKVLEKVLKDSEANKTEGHRDYNIWISSATLSRSIHGNHQTLGGYLYLSYYYSTEDKDLEAVIDNSLTYLWIKEEPSYPTVSKFELALALHNAAEGTILREHFSSNEPFDDTYVKAKHGWIHTTGWGQREADYEDNSLVILTPGIRARVANALGIELSNTFHEVFDAVINHIYA